MPPFSFCSFIKKLFFIKICKYLWFMNVGPILKPNDVGAHLFRVKSELEVMLHSVRSWRSTGLDGSGVVPISVLPLETKLESMLSEVDMMINLVSQVKLGKKKR